MEPRSGLVCLADYIESRNAQTAFNLRKIMPPFFFWPNRILARGERYLLFILRLLWLSNVQDKRILAMLLHESCATYPGNRIIARIALSLNHYSSIISSCWKIVLQNLINQQQINIFFPVITPIFSLIILRELLAYFRNEKFRCKIKFFAI